ncbi:AAA family ATPase [Solihabitans fulvus]|uniref:AAA family ATPase n=1 Tax=Solihabitans fulvus TaxID=1892852 RepID=A0A5B2X6A5_9PSEU|nr:AAA family ATPase [Solihabitans fulvus]KAA2258774.1 AAA family ATPase [Solihabitans fulvus]
MPPVARLGSGIPLVARGRELRRLRAALEQASAGAAGAILLAGDAGVGKTRMVDELTAMAVAEGALVLTGRCLDAGETGLPYLPFAEALAQLGGDELAAVQARPALGRLLPALAMPADRNPSRDTPAPHLMLASRRAEQDVGQLQLFDAVHGLLSELAGPHCVLLVIEDLHWADDSTRYLLSFLLARLRSQRLLVVATYRTDDLHRRHPLRPLLTELVRLAAVERIDLEPFGKADSQAFVAALADDRMPQDIRAEVAERSEGNAFFAEELLAAYTACDDGAIPSALADLLLARTERLSPVAQRVVRVASVWGRRLRHERLRAVAELDDTVLDEALREAVQLHVLQVEDGADVYLFRHALVREAVYGDLLPGERVRLHASYARYLAGRLESGDSGRGTAAALAHHSMESNDLPQALSASVRAAAEADKLGAPAESLKHLEQALKLWDAVAPGSRPGDVTELMLLRRASWSAGTAGQPERAVAYARSAVELVDPVADPEQAAERWRRLAQALSPLDGDLSQELEAVDRAWDLVRDRPASHARAWVLAVRAGVLRYVGGRQDEARQCAEDAVRDARAVNAGGAEADALATLGLLDAHAGDLDRAQAHLTQAVERAVQVDVPTAELRARYYLGLAKYDLGEVLESTRVFDEGVARAREFGLTWSSFGLELRILQVISKYAAGDWDGSEAAGEPPGLRVSNTVAARMAAAAVYVTVGRGRFAEAERLITELRTEWHRDVQIVLFAGGCGAELASWRGRPAQAVERMQDALEWSGRVGGTWSLAGIRLVALGISAHADLAARAATRRDAETQAASIAEGDRLAEHARATAKHGRTFTARLGPEGRAWLVKVEAEVTRLHGASDPEAWREAVEAFGYGAVYEQAQCRWRLGEALLSAERRDEAVEQLRLADEVAERLGAVPLRDAVAALAKRARITLRPGAVEEPEQRDVVDLFTPRERGVLRLVALGRTNKQVGEELYISEKTVSVHLSRIMAKLGATRRAEAVAIAYERNLLDHP